MKGHRCSLSIPDETGQDHWELELYWKKNPQESSALLQILRGHYSHSLDWKKVEYWMIFRAQGKLSSILSIRELRWKASFLQMG